MNILLWHVHGSWTTAFVHGKHRYLVPVIPDRGPYGIGRATTYDWPDTAEEIAPEALADEDVDLVILQRPEELALAAEWLRRRIGVDLPAIYVEHNTPKEGQVPNSRHPLADRDDLLIAHVTHFNELFWDTGSTRTTVVEHGVVEPSHRYSGDLERVAVVTNEPIRRWRVTGTDLMPRFAAVAPLDVFGMKTGGLPARLGIAADRLTPYDLPQARLHAEVARRRLYLHLCRWTSLGLSLIEAMTMGMPVVALAATEAVVAVPPDGGVVTTRVDSLVEAVQWLLDDPAAARRLGTRAREFALAHYGLDRFLADWDRLLEEELCALR
jgi:glycosyltransferase involved in cell wall biosynthesis